MIEIAKTKKQTKTAAKKQASEKDLLARLGPVRKVVKMYPAKGTESSRVLILACDHRRIGTPRPTLRCGRCKPGAKQLAK